DRGDVLLQPPFLLRSRNREDILAARQEPRERHLRRRDLPLRGDLLDRLHQLQVLLEIAGAEARLLAPDVVRRDVVDLPDVAGEEAAPEGRIGYEAEAERPAP